LAGSGVPSGTGSSELCGVASAVSAPVSPCADEPPVAASGASATSLPLPAASSSLMGVVLVAVSVSGGPDVDEPFGASLGEIGALAAADAERTAST
jgi:hypothetical protein